MAFGNEANDKDIEEFSRRFGVQVEDGFGSTENAVIVIREPGTPPGSIGRGAHGVAVYNGETVTECAVARFDAHGALTNADEAIGELVNTTGRASSPATTMTPKPTPSACATACTGLETSHTGTLKAGSTLLAAPPTGCG